MRCACGPLQMRALREKMAELQSSHDARISLVLEKYQSLRQQVQKYHEQLTAAISPATAHDAKIAFLNSAVKAITLR